MSTDSPSTTSWDPSLAETAAVRWPRNCGSTPSAAAPRPAPATPPRPCRPRISWPSCWSSHLRYDWDQPELAANDHLIFSKGHASPLLYSMFRAVGVVDENELINTYRQFGGRLQGHPTPVLPWVDVATGSLGQGLPDAVGVALAGKYLDRLPYQAWVLCGDSELAEGSMWEALDKAAYYKLGNLTAIVDVNRLGQHGPTELEWDLDRTPTGSGPSAPSRWSSTATTWPRSITRSPPRRAPRTSRPSSSRGPSRARASPRSRTRTAGTARRCRTDMAERAIGALGGPSRSAGHHDMLPNRATRPSRPTRGRRQTPHLQRRRRGRHPGRLRRPPSALAPVPRSSCSTAKWATPPTPANSARPRPDRYFEMFIAEQQLVAAAVGLSVRGYVPFAASFAAFLVPRPYDFIRMAGVSEANIRLVGTHAGVEIGQDGPSQMALEDLAAMRAVHSSTVLYPADAPSTAQLVQAMADTPASATCAPPAAPTR